MAAENDTGLQNDGEVQMEGENSLRGRGGRVLTSPEHEPGENNRKHTLVLHLTSYYKGLFLISLVGLGEAKYIYTCISLQS